MENKVLEYKTIVQALLARFPEFEKSDEFILWEDDTELPYLVIIGLKNFIFRVVEENEDGKNNELIERIALFMNEMVDSEDPYLVDLVGAGLMEGLVSNKKVMKIISPLMNKNNRDHIDVLLNSKSYQSDD